MSDDGRTQETAAWPPRVGLTVEEAAQSLRVSAVAIREAIQNGGLPARIVGRGYRIDVDALKHWLATGTGEGRKPAGADAKSEDA